MPYQTFLPYCYKNIICLLLAGMPTYQTWAQTSWQQPFEDCGINGSITIYDYNRQVWMTSDMADSQVGTLPASTFKILNTLIVLETGAIADDHEIIPWISDYDTTKYGHRPSIYKDMDLEEAFYKSAGWAYRELAKKVGDERYLEILTEIGYGNGDLSIDDPDFWNYGAFQVTPTNQVQTMMDIFEEKLPFSPEAYSTLKRLMITEEGEGYVIRAKTGWTRAGGRDTGWWVGYLTTEDNVYFFATRLIKDRNDPTPNFGNCRKEITKAIFQQMGVL